MPRNKLEDLNNHLFEQLERLNDNELSDDELKKEIDRSKQITSIANSIISIGELALNAEKFKYEIGGSPSLDIPLLLSSKNNAKRN